ncbi:MAG: TIGR01212 family radical SAM protein [Alistipes sp.]|nr:TIGR01212 family radical SAM protein [Alistipes sp.]
MSPEQLPYNDYGAAMRRRLGGRVQKLAIDAGLSCPNRDGTIAYGGCSFCLNDAFSPAYCRETTSITKQIELGIDFHLQRRRESDIYLAYFQSGTNSHAPISRLRELYNEALSHPKISGIIIGTRPDCVDSEKLQLLSDLRQHHYVAVEYGIESINDATLQHVNRGHTYASAIDAIARTKAIGVDVGAHFILGLPNESYDDIINSVAYINNLNLNTIKFHQLQIYRNTPIALEWHHQPANFLLSTPDACELYTSLLVDIIRRLRPDTAIERFTSEAPRHLLLHSPLGGMRPDQIRNKVVSQMIENGYRQGDLL